MLTLLSLADVVLACVNQSNLPSVCCPQQGRWQWGGGANLLPEEHSEPHLISILQSATVLHISPAHLARSAGWFH